MATLSVDEHFGFAHNNGISQGVQMPPLVHQSVTYTVSTQSNAFGANTRLLRVCPSSDAYVVVAANPTATVAAGTLIGAGQEAFFWVKPGHKIAAYDGTS